MFLNKLCRPSMIRRINGLTNSLRRLTVTPAVQFSSKTLPESVAVTRDASLEAASGQNVINKVNEQVAAKEEGRLFAVVHLCGKQFKVTSGDIIVVEGGWPPGTGDKIRLDKVLLAGGKDFSLVGRPLVQKDLVDVQATIIEKTLSHTRTNFRKRRRKQYQRINFHRNENTMVRINSIEVKGKINENPDPDPEITRIF
ncbi:Ribosomal protein L21 [Sergentomyia squamirostris]